MKKQVLSIACVLSLGVCNAISVPAIMQNELMELSLKAAPLSIKVKNDTGEEMSVINAGSGGTYRLQKNIVTTIKMDAGDKLFVYDGGKKGRLLLTASADLDGKVQLVSKL